MVDTIMGQAEFAHRTGQLDRRHSLLTIAVAAAAGSVIAAPAAQGLEAAGTVRDQPAEGNVNAWNLGLITAHGPEFTPAENRLRMGDLRADVDGSFEVLEVREGA
jgi:hypothetical protein